MCVCVCACVRVRVRVRVRVCVCVCVRACVHASILTRNDSYVYDVIYTYVAILDALIPENIAQVAIASYIDMYIAT